MLIKGKTQLTQPEMTEISDKYNYKRHYSDRWKAKDASELTQMAKGSLCRVVLFRNVSLNVCPTNLRLGRAYNFAQSFRNVTQPPIFGY